MDEQYVKTGVVRFGFQHMAFLGQESVWAAEASECAADQNAFWPYHDKLFASQKGENQGAFAKENLKRFAADLKLDTKTFNQCLDSGKYTKQVQDDTQAVENFGVQSTPSFVINGRGVQGSLTFDQFQQLIEQARTEK